MPTLLKLFLTVPQVTLLYLDPKPFLVLSTLYYAQSYTLDFPPTVPSRLLNTGYQNIYIACTLQTYAVCVYASMQVTYIRRCKCVCMHTNTCHACYFWHASTSMYICMVLTQSVQAMHIAAAPKLKLQNFRTHSPRRAAWIGATQSGREAQQGRAEWGCDRRCCRWRCILGLLLRLLESSGFRLASSVDGDINIMTDAAATSNISCCFRNRARNSLR